MNEPAAPIRIEPVELSALTVRVERPPIYDAVVQVFPVVATRRAIVFTYGSVLFNPSGIEIPPELMAHELLHGRRQLGTPGGAQAWWTLYLVDRKFRFNEELLAHQEEFRAFCDRQHERKSLNEPNDRRIFLAAIARRLSGPIYGYAVTFEKAKILIKRGAYT